MGKAKGFLTYDEVNEHMPESITSSDQMDDWLTTFSGEGIELVDATTQIKVAGKARPAVDTDEEEGEGDEAQEPPAKKAEGAEATRTDSRLISDLRFQISHLSFTVRA